MVHNKNFGSYKQNVIPSKMAVFFTVGEVFVSYGVQLAKLKHVSTLSVVVSKIETCQHSYSKSV